MHIVLSACETAAISTVTHYSDVPFDARTHRGPFAYVITRRGPAELQLATPALAYLYVPVGSKGQVTVRVIFLTVFYAQS